jgi:hypothetical protein
VAPIELPPSALDSTAASIPVISLKDRPSACLRDNERLSIMERNLCDLLHQDPS